MPPPRGITPKQPRQGLTLVVPDVGGLIVSFQHADRKTLSRQTQTLRLRAISLSFGKR